MDGRQSSTDRIPARADDLTASAASDQRHGQQAGPRRASQAPRTEACLRGIYRSTTIGIGLVTNRIMQDVNDRLCEMVGYSLEELLGKDARMLYLNDDDYDHVGRQAYRPVAECGTVETRWRRKDGGIIYVLLTSTPLDPDDLSEGVLFTVLDITARKAAEEELQSLFDLSLDMVCIADIHTATFVKVNPAFERTLGYTQEELRNRSFLDLIHPDDVAQTRAVIEEKLQNGQMVINFENRYRHKDGSYRWLSWMSHPMPERGVTYAVARDVTEQKQQDMMLRTSEQRYRTLFEAANDGIFILRDGRFAECNSTILAMFGCTPEQILGRRPEDVSPRVQPDGCESASKATEYVAAAFDGTPQRFEWQHLRHDGTPFHTEVSLNAVHLPAGLCVQAIVRDVTDRKKAEEVLRESEAILNETGMIARIGGWKHDLASGKATWTRALYDIIEIEPGHPVPGVDEHLDYYRPEDRRRLEEAYRRAIERGEPFDLELQAHTAKGRPLCCRVLGRPVMRDGKCVEMRGTFQDITEYHKARQEIESVARFPSENPWPVMRIDHAGTILYANPASGPLLTEMDTAVGRRAPASWCEAIRRVHASNSAEHLEVDLQGATLAFEIVPIPNAAHVNVYGTDITRHRRAEEQLRRERDRSQTYLDVAGVMFVALDSSGRVSLVNRKGCEILGYDEREILGMDWFANFVPERMRQDVWTIFDKLLQGQTSLAEYAETPVTVRDRSERIIAWHNTVLTDEAGRIVGTLSSGEDITQRKRTEQELGERQENEKQKIEAELARVRDELVRKTRLAALGQVSGSIAHDLRNPLGAVRNASYLLRRRLPADQAPLLGHITIIEQEVIKADRIITNLLNITRARSPNKEPVDVGAIARAVWKRCVYPEGVRFRIELPEEPFIVQADQGQLSQVLSNLIGNAADALEGEGDCVLETARESGFDVLIVRDTGPGWSPEVRERLFEPLVTTKTSGTGLGLAICRQIIESHGGTIEAIDGIPHGAAVRIRLPR